MAKALFPLHGIARLDLTHFCFQELFLILFSSADSNPSKWTEFLADHGSNLVSNCCVIIFNATQMHKKLDLEFDIVSHSKETNLADCSKTRLLNKNRRV